MLPHVSVRGIRWQDPKRDSSWSCCSGFWRNLFKRWRLGIPVGPWAPYRHTTGFIYPKGSHWVALAASNPLGCSTKRSSTRTKAVVEVDDPKSFWQKTDLHAEEPEDEDLQLGARLVSVLGHQWNPPTWYGFLEFWHILTDVPVDFTFGFIFPPWTWRVLKDWQVEPFHPPMARWSPNRLTSFSGIENTHRQCHLGSHTQAILLEWDRYPWVI